MITLGGQIPIDIKRYLQGQFDYLCTRLGEGWRKQVLAKEVVQNSWAARKSVKEWSLKLDLLKADSKEYLTIEDHGSTGLIGSIPTNREHLQQILDRAKSEDNREEKLAFFLSFEYAMHGPEDPGQRGRGKSILFEVSKSKKIFFDTKRASDDKYIFSVFNIGREAQEGWGRIFIEEEGVSQLRQHLPTFTPKRDHGLRIIIEDPLKEIIDSFKKGDLEREIQFWWWAILAKYNARIYLNGNQIEKSPFLPPTIQGSEFFKEFKCEDDSDLIIPENREFIIKKIIFSYIGEKKDFPDSKLEGIHFQRADQLIETKSSYELVGMPLSGVYGIIEFDRKLDNAVAGHEDPYHLGFSWSRSSPLFEVKKIIKAKLTSFAEEAGILEVEKKESRVIKKASLNAARRLAPVLKNLNFLSSSLGDGEVRNRHKRGQDNPIRLSFGSLRTPSNSERLDFGESLKDVTVKPISEYNESIAVIVKIRLEKEDGIFIDEKTEKVEISSSMPSQNIGWQELKIRRSKFRTGKLYIRAFMTAVEDKIIKKGGVPTKKIEASDIICVSSRMLWINQDPEKKGFGFIDMSGPINILMSPKVEKTVSGRHVIKCIYFNSRHPYFKQVSKNSKELENRLVSTAIPQLHDIYIEGEKDIVEKWKPIAESYAKAFAGEN
ncbi:hypothetical protein ISS86_02925 [Candidatus Microgenomates bacterium]|nr:hypothetical protein [Candidatus Microgenomates bacterium]